MPRFVLLCAITLGWLSVPAAATAREPRASQASMAAAVEDVLEAEKAGLVEVKYIPNDSRSAQIVVTNRSDRPLTLRLPGAFAGVPVLAQLGGMGGGGGGNAAGFGAGGIGAAPQSTGGGAQNAGMGIGGNAFPCWVAREVYGPHDPRWVVFRDWLTTEAPAWFHDAYVEHGESFAAWIQDKPAAKQAVRFLMDMVVAGRRGEAPVGGQFRVPEPAPGTFPLQPHKTRTFRFATVCLEHGKPEPSPRIPYKLQRLESFSGDPRLAFVIDGLASGAVTQKVAQAAAWHIANGLPWERLAAEMIDHAGGDPDEPFFSVAELAAAQVLVAAADKQQNARKPERSQAD